MDLIKGQMDAIRESILKDHSSPREKCEWCDKPCEVRNHCRKCGNNVSSFELAPGEEGLCGYCA